MNNKKGFTLVELLVTIVILGIITAMSIPLIGVIRDANTKRKYKAYLDSLVYNSKLYVDSYQDDLFQNQDSGCAYISYDNLKDHLNIKDINIDDVTCATENTFVKVSKLFGNYNYNGFLGCKDSTDDESLPNIFYPEKNVMDDTCGVDAKAIMGFSFTPEEYIQNQKKKVSIQVKIRSNTGIDPRAKILYGFYKIDDINLSSNYKSTLANDYTKVLNWNTLSLTIPNQSTQLNQFKNGKTIEVISNALETPQGATGQYRLVLKIEELSDLAGVPWKTEEESEYRYSPGLYQIDNQPPVINSFKVVSNNTNYRSNDPKLQIDATDNGKYSSVNNLGACFSLDGVNPCSTNVSNMKARVSMTDTTGKYHKLSDINNHQVFIYPNNKDLYDGKNHKFKIVISDMAGNYTEKEIEYQVAQKYTLNFNSNGGSKCNPSKISVQYNLESLGTWKNSVWTTPFCSTTKGYYTFQEWNEVKFTSYQKYLSDLGKKVDENTKVSNDKKDLTVYAVWKPEEYKISYNLGGGSVSGNPTTYNIESEEIVLKNPTKPYYRFTGWTGTGLSKATVTVKIPKGSYGDRAYTANWEPYNAKIRYNTNGGKSESTIYPASSNGWIRKDGTTYYTIIPYGSSNDLNNVHTTNYFQITKNGYKVVVGNEWKTTSGTESGKTFNQATNYKATDYCDMKDSDCTLDLYVNWVAKKYTITYKPNGGKESNVTQDVTYDSTWKTKDKQFTRDGHTQDGWSTTSDGGVTHNLNTNQGKYTSTSGTTLYAHWKKNSYTITYDGNGNTGGSTTKTTCEYQADCSLRANGFEKEGNTFDGWYTKESGGTKYGSTTKLSSDITVYAHWEKILYTLTIKYSSTTPSSTTSKQQTAKTGETVKLPLVHTLFTYKHHTSDYWYYSLTSHYTPGNSYKANNLASAANCDLTKNDCTIELYANWRETTITLVFYCNGGEVIKGGDTPSSKIGWKDGKGSSKCNNSDWKCCDMRTFDLNSTAAKESGIRDHNYSKGGTFHIKKSDSCPPTDYWLIGNKNSNVKLNETKTYDTMLNLLKAFKDKTNYYELVEKQDVYVPLYAEFQC